MSKKYGRTFHLPQSPGASSDDKIMPDVSKLAALGEVVATEKMDWENTTIPAGGCHPRSLAAGYHPSRDWMKGFAAGISPSLGPDERIIGEYLFARHSVGYDTLPSYFLGFAWVIGDVVQSWADTLARFDELGILAVPELYRGPWKPDLPDTLAAELNLQRQEGFVLRRSEAFSEADMPTHLGKFVRAGHVQSEVHWTKAPLVKNGLLS
jgi:hypothetical protein